MNNPKASAPKLADVQNQWFDWLEQDMPQLSSHLIPAHKTQPNLKNARLNIYRNNRFQVLLSTLQQHFPLILALVGINYFKQLARQYNRQHPPSQRNLHNYGLSQTHCDSTLQQYSLSFSEFLKSNGDIRAVGLEYLAPLAELESALLNAYFTPDDHVWDVSGFAQLAPGKQMRCQLKLSQSLTLLRSQWDLQAIVNNVESEDKIDEDNNNALQLMRDEFYFAVYRNANKPKFCTLTANEYRALLKLKTKDIELANWLEQHTCAAHSLADWINCGWVTHFNLPPAPAEQQQNNQRRSKHVG